MPVKHPPDSVVDRRCWPKAGQLPRQCPPLQVAGSSPAGGAGRSAQCADPARGRRAAASLRGAETRTTKEQPMATRLNPYISFSDNARQAMEFYNSVFGGTLTLSTFAEFGAQDSPDADKIMHGMLVKDDGF